MARWLVIAFYAVWLGGLYLLIAFVLSQLEWELRTLRITVLLLGCAPGVAVLSGLALGAFNVVCGRARADKDSAPLPSALSLRPVSSEGATRCPFCLSDVGASESKIACQQCAAPQHVACWTEAGGSCSACRGSAAVLGWTDLLQAVVERDDCPPRPPPR